MRVFGRILMTLVACSLTGALAQGILVRKVEADLAAECNQPGAGLTSCFESIRLHGVGKDDEALATLSRSAPDYATASRYKVASSWPKDQFWIAVATSGAPATDCARHLSEVLDSHLLTDSESLLAAATDYSKSNFTALYDLFQGIPTGGFNTVNLPPPGGQLPPFSQADATQTYRYCFADPDRLFQKVRGKLKPRY